MRFVLVVACVLLLANLLSSIMNVMIALENNKSMIGIQHDYDFLVEEYKQKSLTF